MGKKRVAFVGESADSKIKAKKVEKPIIKSGKAHSKVADMATQTVTEAVVVEKKIQESTELVEEAVAKPVKKKQAKAPRKRGKHYNDALKLVDRNKSYPLPEAIKLLKSVSLSSFVGSVDLHFMVTETGLSGEVVFPHPTGKKQNIRIADEQLVKELEEGKINFTALIATPSIMPKLAKYAKILGPRGLMPNPKAGTISDKPEEIVKRLSGVTTFRTETKFPLIHMTVGKVDYPEDDLADNIKALVVAVGKKKVLKITAAPTMGPGIKIDLASI